MYGFHSVLTHMDAGNANLLQATVLLYGGSPLSWCISGRTITCTCTCTCTHPFFPSRIEMLLLSLRSFFTKLLGLACRQRWVRRQVVGGERARG
jgi:hypothetical protein